MKKLIAIALCTATMLSVPAAQAQRHDRRVEAERNLRQHQADRQREQARAAIRKDVIQQRNWRKGERFDRRYARDYQVIDYRRYRGLRAPPRGYHYVRDGNNAVLVAITSGIVAAVVANAIR